MDFDNGYTYGGFDEHRFEETDRAQSGLQVEGRNKEATEVKEIKVAWCENFIKAAFAKIYFENGGIEANCCWIE